MSDSFAIKPAHKAVKEYYAALEAYGRQDVEHEGAVRSAFQNLLDQCGRKVGWTLIPEQPLEVKGQAVRPDGTFQDDYYMKRGFWEAKDTHDRLELEIRKKIDKGYPLTNTIFEDTRHAHLYQNGQQAMVADLANPQSLCDLLGAFFAWTEPAHEDFNKAIDEFKQRVPDLARGLVKKIQQAHKDNPRFIEAFEGFYSLCRASLNPNLSVAAVDEMLVQHLLTERLIRKIFDVDDFIERNVVAREVEKVIAALTSESFSRHEFLQSLDRFYLAIESAAATITEFSEKQHFLNTVYERFFQGYSVKVADTHGIVYTPQEIVDFMCASVEHVLEKEFGKRLGSPGVNILDPCTGTGNFIVNLIRRASKRDLPRMYARQLFANEVMLLPYYIAALNIEHAYWERTGAYAPFEGLCFVDTLDLAEHTQKSFEFMNEENTQRVERERKTPITVVIGNPPYNVGQLNENDNNKNRKYDTIDMRIKTTYAKDSRATLGTKLYDAYVKFFRWAVDRIATNGVVCLVTNNSFVDQIAFDGMRRHMLQDFSRIYHVHLEGNVRQNPVLSGTAYNVFGIQVGVGITIAIRSSRHRGRQLFFDRVDKNLRRQEKLAWLARQNSIDGVKWTRLKPDERYTWLTPDNAAEFTAFLPIGSKEAKADKQRKGLTLFSRYSLGVSTNRDAVVYDFDRQELTRRLDKFAEDYNVEVDRYARSGKGKSVDDFLDYSKVKWSRNLKRSLRNQEYLQFDPNDIRRSLYRPFTLRHLVFADIASDELGQFRRFYPTVVQEKENRVIIVPTIACERPFYTAVANVIPNLNFVGFGGAGQCFPFYTYDPDGTNRRENVTDWALQRFRAAYGDPSITKWDIFYYVYGMLHHPGYREKFAENLKRELPRIPLAGAPTEGDAPPAQRAAKPRSRKGPAAAPSRLFRAFADAGKRLAALHLDYESLEPYELEWIEKKGVPLSYRVKDKMRLGKDRTSLCVNDSLTLAGIPPETFDYRLGNRSALEWVVDQYQVKIDKRSGIASDPNRADDPEYIVRLVGQVVRVSLETMAIVAALPKQYGPDPA
ncbi:MAG: N-6 DNA methylase [Pirellulales bacterium]|nr:N-6 DNA methylase [Pirellulales bacterium]